MKGISPMKTEYAGIDYGIHQLNIDPKTGIRSGVIPQNDCLDFWGEESDAFYTPHCPYCGNELKQDKEYKRCPHCYKAISNDETLPDEPDFFYIKDETYQATSDTYGDIFITKSPYFTYAQFCSPCAPGACHLSNELSAPNPNNRSYCFGHDCFCEGKAPYRVFSVETGEEVFA